MVRVRRDESAVAVLEVQRHDPGAQRVVRVAGVIALDRPYGRVCHAGEQTRHPGWADDHILVNLSDDWESGCTDTGVHGRGCATAVAGDDSHSTNSTQLVKNLIGSILTSIIDRNDF